MKICEDSLESREVTTIGVLALAGKIGHLQRNHLLRPFAAEKTSCSDHLQQNMP